MTTQTNKPKVVAFALLVMAPLIAMADAGEALAQMRPTHHANLSASMEERTVAPVTAITAPSMVAGKYTYRSYLNLSDVIVNDDAQSASKALSLIFGEGMMTLTSPAAGQIVGTFDMGGGMVLDLSGTVETDSAGLTIIKLKGPGRPGTGTDGWEYDYQAVVAPTWTAGIGQVPALVGTVLRAKPHGRAKAGVTASFIAIKQP